MTKVFPRALPQMEEFQEVATQVAPGLDVKSLYNYALFMRVGINLEMELETILSHYNLSPGRFTILNMLVMDKELKLMPSEIAQRVGVTQATMSGLISSLEKAELVTKISHERDGRAYYIQATEKGYNTVKEILPQWMPMVTKFWSQLEAEERETFSQTLHKLAMATSTAS